MSPLALSPAWAGPVLSGGPSHSGRYLDSRQQGVAFKMTHTAGVSEIAAQLYRGLATELQRGQLG